MCLLLIAIVSGILLYGVSKQLRSATCDGAQQWQCDESGHRVSFCLLLTWLAINFNADTSLLGRLSREDVSLISRSIVRGLLDSLYLTGNQRDVSFIRTDSITHLYVAFGYITPDTYEIFPIPGSDMATFLQIMQLKQNAPGLRIYLSLGGWSKSMSMPLRIIQQEYKF
jgi:hypothetical protein